MQSRCWCSGKSCGDILINTEKKEDTLNTHGHTHTDRDTQRYLHMNNGIMNNWWLMIS